MSISALSSYRKAIKVVSSCANQVHIKHARNYINLFFKTYSTPSRQNYGPFKSYWVDEWVGEMYSRLLIKLEEKEKSLK